MPKIDAELWHVLNALHEGANYGGNLGGANTVSEYLAKHDPLNNSSDEDETPVEHQPDEYTTRSNAQLESEIDARNDSRTGDDVIFIDPPKNKANLIKALRADDERIRKETA